MKKLLKTYRDLAQTHPRLNGVLFFAGALVSGYITALAPDIVHRGITSPLLWMYAFGRAFLLVSICALAFALLTVALGYLFKRIAVASLVLNVFSCVVGVANSNKILYRDMPILPVDIFMVKDAAIAAVDYDIVIGKSFYLLLAVSAALFAVLLPVRLPERPFKTIARKGLKRLAAGAAALLLCVCVLAGVFLNWTLLESLGYIFSPKTLIHESITNTFYPSFFRAIPALFVKAPEAYSEQSMGDIGADIAAYAEEANGGREADIIILQLETFYYPETFDIEYDREDVFGALDTLAEKGAGGYTLFPLIGGGTADVEFEVLTGFTSNDDQCLVNPFSIYVTEDTPGVVEYLKGRGYDTVSIHSHTSVLYNRINAYKALGFDKSIFSTDFVDYETFGGYVSEKACVDRVIEEYDAIVQRGGKAFIHTVTMQNHTPLPLNQYTEEELVACESDTLSGRDLEMVRIYLTSCRDITSQVVRLTEYLETVDRDVVLIVYGDHQSPIAWADEAGDRYPVPVAAQYQNDTSDEYFLLSHRTPLFVWSSFDYAGEKDLGVLAPNAVLPTVLRAFDVTRPAYFDYLTDSADTYRSVTGDYIIYADGTITTDIPAEALEDKLERVLLQHDFLHGKGYLAGQIY